MRVRLGRKLHPSWLVAWFAAAVIGGIAASFWLHSSDFTSNYMLAAGLVCISITLLQRTTALVLLAVAAGLLLGLWRGGQVQLAMHRFQNYIGQTVHVQATIADDLTHKNHQTGLKLQNVRINEQKFSGQMWAATASQVNLKRYDTVTLIGKLKPGFGTFATSMSYAKIISAQRPSHGDLPRETRDSFSSGLKRAVPEPEAELGIGYLTGQHNNVPDNLTKELELVGLIHLVIAGGYNVTILIRFARRWLSKTSKYLAMVASSAVLLGLTVMAGFTAPMARTAVVTGLSLAAWYYGRRVHPLVLLTISAAITAVVAPQFVWGDVGWYLTFVAYGGLIMLAPILKQLFWAGQQTGTFKQILVDTLAVQIVTMPLMAFAFQHYSIYGLPANLLVLPLMPLTMLAAAIAGLGGMVLPINFARVVGWPATVLLGYTSKVTDWLANAQGADASATFGVVMLSAAYALILVVMYVLWRKTHYNFATDNVVE